MGVRQLYEFGPFLLDPAERVLLREGRPVPLTPKSLDILLVLVRSEGRLLHKQDLIEAVWPDTFVEEGNLTFNISSLRKALGEDRKEHRYIETVPRRGYRFVASVRVSEGGATKEANGEVGEFGRDEKAGPHAAGGHEAAGGVGVQDPREVVEALPAPRAEQSLRAAGRSARRRWLVVVGVVSLLAAAVAFGLYGVVSRQRSGGGPPDLFRGANVTRLTTTRNATDAAISPDGKYVVYVVDEAQQRSLWLRQVTTNSHVQLIPPSPIHYLDLFFSREGDYVYYVKTEENRSPTLYQMPVTGGASRKLLEEMTGPVGLSPDGGRFAFIRYEPSGEMALTVADAFGGGGARKLMTRKRPSFLNRPVWSPDGKTIACIAGDPTETGPKAEIVAVGVADGSESVVGRAWKFIGRVEWLADGGGFLMTASDYSFGPYQIWHVSYPGGEARKVTSDLSNYRSISLSSGSNALVAVQSDIRPYVWVAPEGDAARARQITSGSGSGNDYWGFSWTPDGRIVYVSTLSGNQDIWIMNADGSNQKQLTFDARSDFDPAVSPDGRHIAFASERSGHTRVWRMDIDGGNPTQLTTGGGTGDFLPAYTPDGRWLIYTSNDSQKLTLWKVPAAGGEPSRVTRASSSWAAVSPDGAHVACWHIDERARVMALAVVSLDNGETVKLFGVAPSANMWAEIRWTPDGRALTYADAPDGVGNIWAQPLSGGPPKQLTDFKDSRIFRYDWSRDGKQLACSRGVETNDVVLIGGPR